MKLQVPTVGRAHVEGAEIGEVAIELVHDRPCFGKLDFQTAPSQKPDI